MTDDRDVLTPVYLTGFENGRESERAKIVAWLRSKDTYDFDDLAIDIEAKEHLK